MDEMVYINSNKDDQEHKHSTTRLTQKLFINNQKKIAIIILEIESINYLIMDGHILYIKY